MDMLPDRKIESCKRGSPDIRMRTLERAMMLVFLCAGRGFIWVGLF